MALAKSEVQPDASPAKHAESGVAEVGAAEWTPECHQGGPAEEEEDEGDWKADSEDWESDDAWDYELPGDKQRPAGANRSAQSHGEVGRAQARQALAQKVSAKVNFDVMPSGRSMSKAAENSVRQSENKAAEFRSIGLSQDTRATTEGVLDPRTMAVLSKFLKRGLFDEIHGCISTGKEANVYYATANSGVERAVKIYKTSILVFKDRARYVEGDYRFRRGYAKGNPRKMVEQWAEKEMRNLKRLHAAGFICPEVVEVRQNVLVMDFIGTDGDAAPRLKDADVPSGDWIPLYMQCVLMMRKMFQVCSLIHGDLSEYNLLYHQGELVVIDVSQSMEIGHPQAFEFLKRDCVNVNTFFEKMMDRPVIPVKRLFDFIVTKALKGADSQVLEPDQVDDALDVLLEDTAAGLCDKDAEDEEVFIQTWIPSNLDQVSDRNFIERDIAKRAQGEEVLYERLFAEARMTVPPGETKTPAAVDPGEEARAEAEEAGARSADEDTAPGGDADAESGESEDEGEEKATDGHKPEGMSKKDWKAKVKEERREKLKDKVPKAIKKKHRKEAAKGR